MGMSTKEAMNIADKVAEHLIKNKREIKLDEDLVKTAVDEIGYSGSEIGTDNMPYNLFMIFVNNQIQRALDTEITCPYLKKD